MFDKILLVGGGNAAQFFYETVNKYYYYGYSCVGFVDNKITKLNGCKYYGTINQLEKVLKKMEDNDSYLAFEMLWLSEDGSKYYN